MLKAGHSEEGIATTIRCHLKTLRREIRRGSVEQIRVNPSNSKDVGQELYITEMVYLYDVAQRKHEEKAKNKGPYAKINNCPELRKFIENKIKTEHYSPEAALTAAKKEGFEVDISVKTLYNNIDNGEIGVTRKDLLRRGWKQDKYKPRKALHNLKGESIENRPEGARDRTESGHWEIDLVIGKQGSKHVLLTLTERQTREEIIIRLPNKRQKSVKKALDKLERECGESFKEEFKTVTADNGSEFLNFNMLERSIFGGKRFKMYYAHPYSSWERGTNENANGIIRRFYPKGTDFGKVTLAKIQQLQDWMNNYPRPILGGICANMAKIRAA